MTGPNSQETATAPSDEALIAAVAKYRDKQAFCGLFERYAGRIKAYLMRVGCDEAQAEDLAQEVMLTVWRRAESYDPEKAALATWIYRIARNRRIDLLRRGPATPPIEIDPADHAGAEPGAETAYRGAERDRRMRQSLRALGAEQRQVVQMAFFGELSHAEIAAELALPLGTVKSRLRLGFARLRADLGEGFAQELEED